MANLIWQVGVGGDEINCAQGLKKKTGAAIVKLTDENFGFDTLGSQDKLHIVGEFSLTTGVVDKGMTAKLMAETLFDFGLRKARGISLVICNSGVSCQVLGNKSFAQRLRDELVKVAKKRRGSLFVGAIYGRNGYVNVYT